MVIVALRILCLPRRKMRAAVPKDRMTCCKRKREREREKSGEREADGRANRAPLSSFTPSARGSDWLMRERVDWSMMSRDLCVTLLAGALIIIQFIIQSERLSTALRILTDSPFFNSPFEPPPSLPFPPSPILPYLPEEPGMDR